MGWDKRGYYYQARKVNGRVIREYIGAGVVGETIAAIDEMERDEREWQRFLEKKEREEYDEIEKQVEEVNSLADLLARAALQAAGFHQHNRGEWRKRRVRNEGTNGNES